jgi:hypothetical protein
MRSLVDDLAAAIARAASIAHGGVWNIDAQSEESFVAHGGRRVALVRDHGPLRVVMLMDDRDGRPVLAGQKGPLDPRVFGERLASFVARHPDVETILDVAPRLRDELGEPWRVRWEGHWDGTRTLACIERPGTRAWIRCAQEAHGVEVMRFGDMNAFPRMGAQLA